MSIVFALATPPSKSAICVFRVSGKGCLDSLNNLISVPLANNKTFYVREVFYKEKLLDTVGIISFKGPASYSGEDSFEVYAHGGLGVMSLFVSLFKELGFDEAPPGEFTKRAFLNGKLSLSEAESVVDVIDSSSSQDVYLSSKSLSGAFTKSVVAFAKEIDFLRVRVEGEIDFSDEGQEFLDPGLVDDARSLVDRFNLFIGGCVSKKNRSTKNNILFVGPVNSGKSSVFNRLLGFERAIVSSAPGTTRDLIESELFYNDMAFSVSDTAGLRDTDDPIEVEGIDYGLSEIKEADLVVGIFDSIDEGLMDRFELLMQDKKYLKVFNKVDIQKPKKDVFDYMVSAKTGEGFGLLKEGLASSFKLGEALDSTFLVRERHVKLFNDCVASLDACLLKIEGGLGLELVAEDLKIARSFLDEVVGLKTSDSLLGDIFSSFCIGK